MTTQLLVITEHHVHIQVRTLLLETICLPPLQNSFSVLIIWFIVNRWFRICKFFLLVRTLRIRHSGFQSEMLADKPVKIKIIRPLRVRCVIFMIQCWFVQWIQETVTRTHVWLVWFNQISILIINLIIRVRLGIILERTIRWFFRFHLIHAQLISKQQLIIQIIRKQETDPEPISRRFFHHSRISLVIHINSVTHALVPPLYIQGMFMSDCNMQRLRQPIRVYPFLHSFQTLCIIHP